MNWILQSLLPMKLVQKTKFPSISAANGQFMMFDTEEYRKFQWHSRVKNQNVEDIRLARMIKSHGLKMAVLLGNHDIYCRMYQNTNEALLGFSRNIHEYFGGYRMLMSGFWLLVSFGPFIVLLAIGWKFLVLFGLITVANRIFVSGANRQKILRSVLLHPLHMVGFSMIVFANIFRKMNKETSWKGRKINLQDL